MVYMPCLSFLVMSACALTAHAIDIDDSVFEDFERSELSGWSIEGEAFSSAPARADRLNIQGHRGLRLANSFATGDSAIGSMTSKPFEITHTHISFLIGGGRHDGETGIRLFVDGEAVRSATGHDAGDLRWESWDVSMFRGKQGRLQIFDRATGQWGHINIDQIVLTNQPRSGSGTWRAEQYRRAPEYYQEPFRPAFHFTPELNWMNDPNGLVFYDGEYHLFYQHNPHGNSWGHMSWGHAVSADLLHWKHLPIALHDEYGVMAFSGSAVVDWQNTSGFAKHNQPPLVAIYTGHGHNRQTQDIAYSNDRGRTWIKYENNPVLDIGQSEFRDPKVFWHEPTKRWVMVVSLAPQKRLQFYGSANLRDWQLLSEFGPAGAINKPNWECPDLFELPVENEPDERRWILEADMGSGAVAGGSGGEYFIGQFDGSQFVPDSLQSEWVDYGRDFYAPISWNDIPSRDGRRLWIGWMNNWETCLVPTWPWRSAMSIPRELTLRRINDKLRLCQRPVREIESLRGDLELRRANLDDGRVVLNTRGQQLEISAEFEIGSAEEVGVRVLKDQERQTVIGFDTKTNSLFVDRTQSGISDFHPAFAGRHAGPLHAADGRIRMRILVDRCSVEVFGNHGETVLTDLVFPESTSDQIEVYARGGQARVFCEVWPMASVWK